MEKPTRTPSRVGPPSPTPEFRAEGTALLYADNIEMQPIPEGYIDLDTGTVGDPVAGDLVFLVGCGSDCFPGLMAVNGAAGARMGFKAPGTPTPRLEDCAEVTDFTAADFVVGIGLRLCLLTNEGRYSLVWIESTGFTYPRDQLAILFQTWELPPSVESQ
jgi:hypothetical protein